MQNRLALPAALIVLGVMAAPALAATNLTGDEIKNTFATGAAFTATTVSGTSYAMVLKPDGTASRTAKGKTAPTAGTWRVSATGYCSKWDKATENCYTIQKTAKAFDVLDTAKKVVAHWKP